MPGWYIHMDVARRALASLSQNANASGLFSQGGPAAATLTDIAKRQPAYAALGAIGPDIFFLLPDFKPPVGSLLWKLAHEIRDLYEWWDENFLGPFETEIGPIGDNLDDEIAALTGGLSTQLEAIFSRAFSFLENEIIKLITQQFDVFGLLSSGVPAGYDEQTFFWSDMLHYRQTYGFAAKLWQLAGEEEDPVLRERFQAFALGWMTHLATDVTGHAFVNQKAGGPYRLHWQRHHLVENHMDAAVYDADNGNRPTYQALSAAALHLWLAFNPDGSSRVDFFDDASMPSYPSGDSSPDILARHAAWDVDSDIPDDLAEFIASALKSVYQPDLSKTESGQVACCPTIISTLDDRVPIATSGYANAEDVNGAYFWLFKYVKLTTTDFFKIRRPEPPDVLLVTPFPSPPGTGDSDPGPGPEEEHSFFHDALDLLLALFAWVTYLGQILVWPAALVAGIINGTITYPLRAAIYEYLELPLYNAWLAVHTYLAMTGYVAPMPSEINKGLHTLGVTVDDAWQTTVAALNESDGGLTPSDATAEPSGGLDWSYPHDVVIDPPGTLVSLIHFLTGGPSPGGERPSEFRRPWRFPEKDNEGDPVFTENPTAAPGPHPRGVDPTVLMGGAPGSNQVREELAAARSERETIEIAAHRLRQGLHMGDAVDYSAYVIAQLTRGDLSEALGDPAELRSLPDLLEKNRVANFNLDADRGYGYLCWDWLRLRLAARAARGKTDPAAMPGSAFSGDGDPAIGGAPDDLSEHVYPVPKKPGFGFDPADQISGPTVPEYDPRVTPGSVEIRYIDKEKKFL